MLAVQILLVEHEVEHIDETEDLDSILRAYLSLNIVWIIGLVVVAITTHIGGIILCIM